MSFLQGGFLFACAAAAIPVIVHLLNRWQVREIELGTIRFLSESIRDGARRRRIRRWFLLLVRMTLAALLALLFARPFVSEAVRRDGNRVRVILIDRSASMAMPGENGRLIDDAVAVAVDTSQALGEDATQLWAWFDRQVEPFPFGSPRSLAPRTVVGGTDYAMAINWARNRIESYPTALADVVLITDLQHSGMTSEGLGSVKLDFPADVPVRIIDVGRPAANNLAITDITAPTTRMDVGAETRITVTVFSHGTLPFEDAKLLIVAKCSEETKSWQKSISVLANQAEDVEFDLGPFEAGRWRITASIDVDDDLAVDNRRWTAIEVAEPIEVLVLDDGADGTEEPPRSYYLVSALHQSRRGHQSLDAGMVDQAVSPDLLLPRSRFQATVINLSEQTLPDLDPTAHRIVVVAAAGGVSRSQISRLEEYVRRGGKLLVFAGDSNDPVRRAQSLWKTSGLAPGTLESPQRSGAMPFRITNVSRGGEMMAPFEDPQHGNLGRLSFQKVQPVGLREDVRVLASFEAGRAAITKHRVDQGSVVWFLSSVDSSWSNWTTSPLYLPVVQQMVADLLGLTGEGTIRFRSIGDLGDSPNQSFSRLGISDQADVTYVVNGTAKESDPTRIDQDTFAKHFNLTLGDLTGSKPIASVDTEEKRELWPWFAALAFLLMFAEFTLANRTRT